MGKLKQKGLIKKINKRGITNDTIKLYRKNYEESKGNGKLYNEFIVMLNILTKDKDIKTNIIKDIILIDNKLNEKTTIMQKVILNRYLVSKLLRLSVEKDIDTVNYITECNALNKEEYWKNIVFNTILPFIIKHEEK